MNIVLKELTLSYFKGIKNLSLTDLDTPQVNIYGRNATGKSTIADAWCWLLFHKDSSDRSEFEIKTVNAFNEAFPKVDHSVTAVLLIDGDELELKKIYREKWVVTNGETDEHFAGHETIYYINGAPSTKKAYDERINALLGADILKMITSTAYFNDVLPWDKRRAILFKLAGDMTDDDVIDQYPDLEPLREILRKFKPEDYRRRLNSEILRIQKDMDVIPARIDEVYRTIPAEIDAAAIAQEIADNAAEIDGIDRSLTDLSAKFEQYKQVQADIFRLESQQRDLENEARLATQDKQRDVRDMIRDIQYRAGQARGRLNSLLSQQSQITDDLNSAKGQQDILRTAWHDRNAEVFGIDADTFVCPTCKRPLDEADIIRKTDEMKENFNRDKASALKNLSLKGRKLTERINEYNAALETIASEIESAKGTISEADTISDLEKQLQNTKPVPVNKKKYETLQKQIADLRLQLQKPEESPDQLNAARKAIINKNNELKIKLATQDARRRAFERIDELKAGEQHLAVEKAGRQQYLQLLEQFVKAKVECLEAGVNSKFRYVRFKLFRTQVNGGQEECCEALINGVPYGSANNAARINAGLDVINAISEWAGVAAPVFIDNRESVNEIIETDSQVINLYVTDADDELRIETEYMEREAA